MDLKKFIEDNKLNAIEDLKNWIKIHSVDDSEHALPFAPFGLDVELALHYIGQLGEKAGFKVDYCNGYATEITVGSGEHLIAIYAHCDVVPATGDWKYDPFSGQIEDGVMYGRGTSDDKGPAIAAFYALKAIKEIIESNKKYRVQLVIGGNEEKGSKCLEYYFDTLKKPYPDYGFTPDGDFPLIYGEKGISNYSSSLECNLYPIVEIRGGEATNSVIDKAYAIIKDRGIINYLKEKKIKYKVEDVNDDIKVIIYGKSAHGSLPELGINAGMILLDALGEYYNIKILKELAYAYKDTSGANMNLCFESSLLHKSTYNVGLISYDGKALELTVNFRYPENVEVKDVIKRIDELYGTKTMLLRDSKPLLMKPDSPLVTNLLKAYRETTGDYETPIMTIGGGTYARDSRNTIAFGSHFPSREDHIHEPNEKIHLEDFLTSIEIYARGIMELLKL